MEKTVQNIPFLRLTIALVTGIIAGTYFTTDINYCVAFLAMILVILFLLNRNYKYPYSFPFGLGINLFIIFLGVLVTQQFNKKPVFYDKGNFTAVISEVPQEKPNSWKSIIQIATVYQSDSIIPTKEFAIAYFEKDETVKELKAGDIILFGSVPQPVTNNNNPYEFDYKKYLGQKRIYRQVYLSANNWIKTSHSELSLSCRAEQIRENFLKIYRSQPIDDTEFEILSALTLGYRRELDPETKRVFSASGASHVLAVSGLHVGIVFWVISLLFGFLKKQKEGRILFMLLSISILWFYAFLTGLSPSVMRASVMFSIFVIGENSHRKSNIYNSLAASAFILLLINPNNFYDIGFQLSYAAVFGIVFLQPLLENLILVKNKIIRFFWQLITVSIAAQIATFPITTYYFGQFPTYFWITNSFVIPAVMVLIPLGIFLLFASKVYVLSNVLAILLNYLIKITYFLLSSIEQLPFSVFEISINQVQLILIIAIVASAFIYLKNQKAYLIKTSLIFAILLSVSTLLFQVNRLNHKELIVYNTAKNPAIHLIQGENNYIISEEKIKKEEQYFFPGTAVKKKLGLKLPVFLISTDTITSENIVMKNGFIFFEGKSLSLRKKISDLNKTNMPDFVINPSDKEINTSDIKAGTIIVSNKRYLEKNMNISDQIHYTTLKGAFRKKW